VGSAQEIVENVANW